MTPNTCWVISPQSPKKSRIFHNSFFLSLLFATFDPLILGFRIQMGYYKIAKYVMCILMVLIFIECKYPFCILQKYALLAHFQCIVTYFWYFGILKLRFMLQIWYQKIDRFVILLIMPLVFTDYKYSYCNLRKYALSV